MKIALLAHNLHSAGGLSVGRSILSTFPVVAPQHEYLLTVPQNREYELFENHSNIRILELPVGSLKKRYAFEQSLLKELKQWNCDWAWILGNNLLLLPKNIRMSLLLHSSFYLNYPLKHWRISRISRFYARRKIEQLFVRRTLWKSHRVYGQTNVVCQRIHETFRYPKDQIDVCHMGTASEMLQRDTLDSKSMAHCKSLDSKFKLLYVSAYNPHKNFENIVQLFAKFKEELRDVVLFLTFSPEQNQWTQRLHKKVIDHGLDSSIVFLGSIPHEEISQVYAAADALFFPTLLETVGLGHLEAMAYGLPVIASDLDFAHEVCGDAACFVDPFSLESMKNGILEVKDNEQLRYDLAKKGKIQLERNSMTWEDSLKSVMDQEGIPYL